MLRCAGSTKATNSVNLSTAEAEYYAMVSAVADAKQVQGNIGDYLEDTPIILEADWAVLDVEG